MIPRLDLVIIGLSITSSWGNGHATTYRALVRALADGGHRVLFLERDVPWYAAHRDASAPAGCEVGLYSSLSELRDRYSFRIRHADAVLVGSYVPDGVAVADWLFSTATGTVGFYDIDTPVTLRMLRSGGADYLHARQVKRFDVYFSFAGGLALRELEGRHGARRAVPLYCSVDPLAYAPRECEPVHALTYLGTYSADRQDALSKLLVQPARRLSELSFMVAGAQYPDSIEWPENVARREHVAPPDHPSFYCASRFTLNVTRADMVAVGHSPSVRLFEAAACGTPVISDRWPGIEAFFRDGEEILLASDGSEVVRLLRGIGPEEARAIGRRARQRILEHHTAEHRAGELVSELRAASDVRARPSKNRCSSRRMVSS